MQAGKQFINILPFTAVFWTEKEPALYVPHILSQLCDLDIITVLTILWLRFAPIRFMWAGTI